MRRLRCILHCAGVRGSRVHLRMQPVVASHWGLVAAALILANDLLGALAPQTKSIIRLGKIQSAFPVRIPGIVFAQQVAHSLRNVCCSPPTRAFPRARRLVMGRRQKEAGSPQPPDSRQNIVNPRPCQHQRLTCERATPPAQQQRALLSSAVRMAKRTEHERKRRAENERRRYTKKRLARLKERFPDLPPDVLERASLRHVSTVVRRIGEGQSVLGAFRDAESSSGPMSNA